MKELVCVSNIHSVGYHYSDIANLTIGGVYTPCDNSNTSYVYVINDSGVRQLFDRCLFRPIDEHRDRQIDRVLNGR
jgi:hypothetical protein